MWQAGYITARCRTVYPRTEFLRLEYCGALPSITVFFSIGTLVRRRIRPFGALGDGIHFLVVQIFLSFW